MAGSIEPPRNPPLTQNRRRTACAAVSIFAISFVVFICAPVDYATSDPQYSLLTSESILINHTPALNQFSIPRGESSYQLARSNGRVLYLYPHGGPIFALPFVLVLNRLGLRAVNPEGEYNLRGEIQMQRLIAAFLMSTFAGTLVWCARPLLSLTWSIALVVAATFGTQILSTDALGLWGHTWEIFFSGFTLLLLIRSEVEGCELHPVLLATLLSFSFFVRPDSAIAAMEISLFVWLYHKPLFSAYAAAGTVWAIVFALYSRSIFGSMMPEYYHGGSMLSLSSLATGLPANLMSPSRGIFVFVPTYFLLTLLLTRYWRNVAHKPLAILALAIIGCRLLIVSSWPMWWGGHGFGPRLLAPLVPWAFLLAVVGVKACPRRRLRRVAAVGLPVVLLAIAINAEGAFSPRAAHWNVGAGIDAHPNVVWRLRCCQLLAFLCLPKT